MSDLGLSKESVKSLGAGAYLVNILPSAVLVLGLFALLTSRLYPWAARLHDEEGRFIEPGVRSTLATARDLGAAGIVLLVLGVLVTAVVLRPFQISAVQWLEGYWPNRSAPAALTALAVERHTRRRSMHKALALDLPERGPAASTFTEVARSARRRHRVTRRIDSALEVVSQYPEHQSHIMPTMLGNILRRAEMTAGERYGLETVTTYPRLYPYLSSRLSQEADVQLNIIDTASTLTIVCGMLGAAAAPLLLRLDAWGVVPIALGLAVLLSYRGALLAAERHATLLASAFDLHRFDMLRAMHRRLPANATEEYADNEALCRVLNGALPLDEPDPHRWEYAHPEIADPGPNGGRIRDGVGPARAGADAGYPGDAGATTAAGPDSDPAEG